MAKIRYIGKKPQKVDTQVIAGTGIVWNGKGDVQEVPDKLVHKFLAHSGDFELVTGATRPVLAAVNGAGEKPKEPAAPETKTENDPGSKEDGEKANDQEAESDKAPETKEPAEQKDETQEPPLVNLEGMDKAALRDYAQRHFGHEFHPNTGEAKMRATIVTLMNRGG